MAMPPKGRADYLRLGDWNANCAWCARKFKASTLRLDWKGLYKCTACWEPRQPQDFVRGVPDMMGAPWVQQYVPDVTLLPVATLPPVVDFVGVPLSDYSPLSVAFTNLSTNATSYVWNFGDGSPTSTVEHPSHTYTAVGTYTVSLSADGPRGCGHKTKVAYVEVLESASPATPFCAEFIAVELQAQDFGGAAIGDGMAQSGPAYDAKVAFLASLQSYVVEPFSAVTTAIRYEGTGTPSFSILGGVGTWYGADASGFGQVGVRTSTANGRFNTSANAAGKYGETWSTSVIDLTGQYTAFGMYYMDLGEFGGELEIDFYNGATRVRTITAPTDIDAKAKTNVCSWMSYSNGSVTFNKVVIKLRQFYIDPSEVDYCGFDDIAVGQCVTCVPSAAPIVHYGINTVATTAKTVAGPAKTARDAWAAAAGSGTYVCDFEDQVAAVAAGSFGVFAGLTGAVIYCQNHTTTSPGFFGSPWINVAALSTGAEASIGTSGAADRWNTTSGGNKWLEWTDELIINLPGWGDFPVAPGFHKLGFYVTDLGNQNATLRITLRNASGGAVVHYMPKAAELTSPAGLLRFWGVVSEIEFLQVVIQVVYYDDLTADTYSAQPAWRTGGAIETAGIDDIIIG